MAQRRLGLRPRVGRWALAAIGALTFVAVGAHDYAPIVTPVNELTSMCVNKSSMRVRWVSSPGGCNLKTETALGLPGGAPIYLCIYPPNSDVRRTLTPGACNAGETPLTIPASGPSFFCYSSTTGYYLRLVANAGACAAGETAVAVSVPVAVNDTYAPLEDVMLNVPIATGVLPNDTDAHNDPLTAQLVTGPTNSSSFALNTDGSFSYKGAANFCGADSFTYRVTDGTYTSTAATVTLNVTCVNDAPSYTVGGNQTVFDNAGAQTVVGWATGMSPGPADEAGQTLTFSVTGNTNPGILSAGPVVNPSTGTLTYTPTVGASGATTITLQLQDNGGVLNGGVDAVSHTFTITVNLSTQPPVANNDSYNASEDLNLTVAAPGVLGNDTDPDVGDTVTGAVLQVGPLHALSFTLNANGSFTYTPALNYCGGDSFTYKAQDNHGALSTTAATVTIAVACVNDAPVNVIGASPTTAEDTPINLMTAIQTSDVDANPDAVRVTLNASWGTLTLSGTTGLSFAAPGFGDGTDDSSMSFTGTLTNVNAAMNGMTFTPTLNYSGAANAGVSITTNDLGHNGSGGALFDTDNLVINVTAVNDAPVNTVPGPQSVGQNGSLVFSTGNANRISVADVDAAAGNVTVTLTGTNGTVTLATTAGLVSVSGDGTATVAMTGTLTTVNAAMNGMTFAPTANFTGAASLQIVTNDNGFTGAGGALSDTDSVAITVQAMNQPPVNTVPGPQTIAEDGILTFSSGGGNAISISDPDAGAAAVKVTLNATNGTMILNGTTGLSFSTGDGTADANMVFTGTITNINTALNGMSFTPTLNYNGSASVQIITDDQGNTGPGGAMTDNDSVAVTVTAVDDAPVNTVPGAQTVAEDTDLVFNSANSNLISVADVDAGATPVKVSLDVTTGTLTLSGNTGLTFVDGTSDGTASVHFTGTLTNINAALNGLKFRRQLNTFGPATLTIVSDDQGATGAGGPLTDSDTVSISVTAVNDPPVNAMPSPPTINEDATLTMSGAGAIQISDIDAGTSNPVQVQLTAGNGTLTLGTVGLSFTVGDGTADANMTFTGTIPAINTALNGMIFTPTANFSGMGSISITTDDQGFTGSGGAQSDTDVLMITVNAVDDAPLNTVPGAQSVNEDTDLFFNAGNGNLITVADVDAGTNSIKVSLNATNGTVTLSGTTGLTFVDGTANGQAMVHFTGTLTNVNAALNGMKFRGNQDYNGSASVQIISDDQGNTGSGGPLTDTDSVAITVIPVNDNPVAVNETFTGAVGNTAFGVGTTPAQPSVAIAGNVLTNDSDVDGPGPLTAGPANITSTGGGTVTMNSDGTFTYVPPVGVKNTNDTFTYTVSDGGGGTANGTVTITIQNALVWYADNALGVNGNGTSVSPFNTLASLQGAGDPDGSGDIIFLFQGSGNYTGGLVLEASQHLIGQPEGLVVNTVTLYTASGSNPTITNSAGNGIQLANDVVIRRVNVTGTSSAGMQGNTVTNVDIGPTITVSNSTGAGISFFGAASGTITVGANITHSSGSGRSFFVANRSGGTVTMTGSINDTAGGVQFDTNTGATINVSSALTLSGAAELFKATGGGTVTATNTANTLSATGTNPALTVTSTTIGAGGLVFQSINSSGSAANGILMSSTGSTGGLTVNGTGSAGSGGTIQNTTGDGISLTSVGAAVSLTNMATSNVAGADVNVNGGAANVTYAGTITNQANKGRSVIVQNKTGGTVAFSGAINDDDDGILLNNNTSTTTNFTGGVDLNTAASAAFTATSGGTVNVTGSNNVITTTTGTALNITNTTIGASNVTFKSITAGTGASGPTNAIVLNNTGTAVGAGHLAVAGVGTNVGATGGGVIQRTTGDAISLTSTRDVSLNGLSVSNVGRHGIFGTSVTNLTVSNSNFVTIGNADEEDGFYFRTEGANNIQGTLTVTNVHLEAFFEDGIGIKNNAGQLTVNVTDSEFVNNDDTFGESGILAQATNTAGLNLNVSTSSFDNIEAAAIRWLADGSGAFDANITGNTITNQGGPNNFPTTENIVVSTKDQNTVTFDITGNTINNVVGDGIVVVGDGNVSGRINNNTITGDPAPTFIGDAIRLDMDGVFGAVINSANFTWTVQVDGNTLNMGANSDDGIQILNRDNVGTMNLTINNNAIQNTSSEGVRYFGGERASPTPLGDTNGKVAITNNVFTNTSSGPGELDIILATTDSAVACFNITGNSRPSGTFEIDFSEAETSSQSVPQSDLVTVRNNNGGSPNTIVTNSVGSVAFNVSCTVPLPSHG